MPQLIREAEEMEKLLIPPSNSSSTSQKESDCIICNTFALVDTFIICSLCSKNVHYICNNPNVSAYYKKRPINFKCCVCKPIK